MKIPLPILRLVVYMALVLIARALYDPSILSMKRIREKMNNGQVRSIGKYMHNYGPPYMEVYEWNGDVKTKPQVETLMAHMEKNCNTNHVVLGPQFDVNLPIFRMCEKKITVLNPHVESTSNDLISCGDSFGTMVKQQQVPRKLEISYLDAQFKYIRTVFESGDACVVHAALEALLLLDVSPRVPVTFASSWVPVLLVTSLFIVLLTTFILKNPFSQPTSSPE